MPGKDTKSRETKRQPAKPTRLGRALQDVTGATAITQGIKTPAVKKPALRAAKPRTRPASNTIAPPGAKLSAAAQARSDAKRASAGRLEAARAAGRKRRAAEKPK